MRALTCKNENNSKIFVHPKEIAELILYISYSRTRAISPSSHYIYSLYTLSFSYFIFVIHRAAATMQQQSLEEKKMKCPMCENGTRACSLHPRPQKSCGPCQAGKSVKCVTCKGTGQSGGR